MTETDVDGSTPSSDVKDTAKAQAQNVASTTKDEATQVMDTAKEQVRAVTSDVREQTRQLSSEARDQLMDHAGSQRDRAVESLRSMSDELSGMAERSETDGLGVQLAREAGSATRKAAEFLEDREPGQLVEDVRDLARRRPGAFLIGAAVAGLLVGRATRGAKSAHSSDGSSVSGSPASVGTTGVSSPSPDPSVGVSVPEPAGAPDSWGPGSPNYPGGTTPEVDPGGAR